MEQQPINRIGFLDGLRGLAALYVMLHHARWLLWEGFTEGFALHPERYSMLGKLGAYASLSLYYGHQAVIFFFVLSGFVIHVRYASALAEQGAAAQFDLRPFVVRRWRRIYPVFVVAMLATLALDQLGMAQGYAIYQQATPYALINLNVAPNHTVGSALGNALLIPNAPPWGSNGPLWSLRFEWWFYLLYPLCWLVARRSLAWATALVMVLFALSFVPALWPVPALRLIAGAFPAWWLGALLAEVYAGRLRLRFARIGLLAVLFLVLPFMVAPFVQIAEPLQDFVWALGFTGVLAACLAWQNRGGSLAVLERLQGLGDVSYSLYVIHFPLLVLLSGWLMSQAPEGTLPQDFTWIGIGAVVCLASAYAVHRIIERPLLRNATRR
jgi:peptidoglycan/LPS O-acetylase OafA/YrhL